MQSSVCEKFLRYVAVDTQSDPDSTTFPTTAKQFNLAKILYQELLDLGVSNVKLDEYGYVYGEIPTNCPEKDLPVIGFVSHMDTSPDASGKNVKPRFVENYDGKDIVLNEERGVVLSPKEFSYLENCVGKTLIVTDGTTLLGGDDKAGVAEIMTMAERVLASSEPHPTIKIAFTPDEEVGGGSTHFDVEGFGAKLAYTVDGLAAGELEYENFNAATAVLTINGVGIHPGSAKNKMVNAQELGIEFHQMLPACDKPEHTEGYEGFYHLNSFQGLMEKTTMTYIIRDHDRDTFEARKQRMQDIVDYLNNKYPTRPFSLSIEDSYYNMKEIIVEHMDIIHTMEQAMHDAGVTPIIQPIRGGTDGARLSFMGLPCPNIGTGDQNCHGIREYVVLEEMEKTVEVLLAAIRLYSK